MFRINLNTDNAETGFHHIADLETKEEVQNLLATTAYNYGDVKEFKDNGGNELELVGWWQLPGFEPTVDKRRDGSVRWTSPEWGN